MVVFSKKRTVSGLMDESSVENIQHVTRTSIKHDSCSWENFRTTKSVHFEGDNVTCFIFGFRVGMLLYHVAITYVIVKCYNDFIKLDFYYTTMSVK